MSKLLLSLITCILSITIAHAQVPDTIARKVDSFFAEYDKTNTAGCALAILKDGKIIYERGYGMSNLEYGIAITPSSVFHVASISKQFTAAAIVRLSLEGKLSLSDDVRKYIPEVPDFGHTITLNHILHHTSGLRDQYGLLRWAGWREGDIVTEEDVLKLLKRQKELNFKPGEEFAYSNTGYTLFSLVVKKVIGVSMRDYADSVFFKPLGMYNTHFHNDHAEITPNRTAAYYRDEKGRLKISIPLFDHYGATSLFTTVEDLAKWDENFYSKKIGGEEFIKAMQQTGKYNDNTPQTYASGLGVGMYRGHKTIGHSGADRGYRSHMVRFPEQHFSVIILANISNINPTSLCYQVADLFLKDNRPKEGVSISKVDSMVLKGWAGDYMDFKTKAFTRLAYQNGRLLNRGTALIPLNNFSFSMPEQSSTYLFSGDSTNAKFLLSTRGLPNSHYKKVKEITLTPAQLREYEGEYYSSELDARYRLVAKDTALFMKIAKYEESKITPFIKDVFTGNHTFANTLNRNITITFSRNKKDDISGFNLSTDRLWNMQFEKIK